MLLNPEHIPITTQYSMLLEERKGGTPGNSRKGVVNEWPPRRGRSEHSPSVPSGSIAQEVRAASRPAGIGRKTSPGSWRQGGKSQGQDREKCPCRPWPSTGGKSMGRDSACEELVQEQGSKASDPPHPEPGTLASLLACALVPHARPLKGTRKVHRKKQT